VEPGPGRPELLPHLQLDELLAELQVWQQLRATLTRFHQQIPPGNGAS